MPWNEVTVMDQREEFVRLAAGEDANIALLCRRFAISRKTGHKWIARARDGDPHWARDRPRRPHHSPWQIGSEIEQAIVRVRQAHPAWGGRKIRRRLEMDGLLDLPSPSTITAALHRHGLIGREESLARQALVRFEHPEPNDLWQMDFKGPVPLRRGRCHPLSVIDDHSRYALCIEALGDQRAHSVRRALTATFRRYGLPHRMLMDNGACWGASARSRHTWLGAWLIRLGVLISHGRPYHPQTQGKTERFHRTMGVEALRGRHFRDRGECQCALERFRHTYNHDRPHEALSMEPPSSRYRLSPVAFPESLAPIEYLPGDIVRTVTISGVISLGSRFHQVGRAFAREPVALRATSRDGVFDVYYCHARVGRLDVRRPAHTKYERRGRL
jgi:transposase InsO family protein